MTKKEENKNNPLSQVNFIPGEFYELFLNLNCYKHNHVFRTAQLCRLKHDQKNNFYIDIFENDEFLRIETSIEKNIGIVCLYLGTVENVEIIYSPKRTKRTGYIFLYKNVKIFIDTLATNDFKIFSFGAPKI